MLKIKEDKKTFFLVSKGLLPSFVELATPTTSHPLPPQVIRALMVVLVFSEALSGENNRTEPLLSYLTRLEKLIE